jgi:glucose-6-phosphate isomerase
MASCILSAELQEINGFDQPAVEWGKRALNGMLTGDQGIESQATQSKNQYWIGE